MDNEFILRLFDEHGVMYAEYPVTVDDFRDEDKLRAMADFMVESFGEPNP